MNDNLFDLREQIAVVIGATGVLGGALAEGLARAGATVAVLGRSRDISHQIQPMPGPAFAVGRPGE